jgi:hypothetical protein
MFVARFDTPPWTVTSLLLPAIFWASDNTVTTTGGVGNAAQNLFGDGVM